MKITTRLLKKYITKECSNKEKRAVESWLENHDDEKTTDLSTDELSDIKSEMWEAISSITPKKEAKVIPIYKKVLQYAAAACFLLGSISMIFIYGENQKVTYQAHGYESGHLQITTGGSKIVNIDSDHIELNFSGYLKLMNTSSNMKTVVCKNGTTKLFHLEAGETYYLEKLNGVPYIGKEKDVLINEGFAHQLRGQFTVHVVKV